MSQNPRRSTTTQQDRPYLTSQTGTRPCAHGLSNRSRPDGAFAHPPFATRCFSFEYNEAASRKNSKSLDYSDSIRDSFGGSRMRRNPLRHGRAGDVRARDGDGTGDASTAVSFGRVIARFAPDSPDACARPQAIECALPMPTDDALRRAAGRNGRTGPSAPAGSARAGRSSVPRWSG